MSIEQQREFSEREFEEIHNIVFPADVRESDLITASVRPSIGDADFEDYRVWKLSPLGIELLPPSGKSLPKGSLIDLRLVVGSQTTHFEGLVVALDQTQTSRNLIGIRLAKKSEPRPRSDASRRRGSRWICSSQFDPVCMASNPLQFNDFLYFKIRDISKSGLRVVTSLRNKFIVPGMELKTQISFPLTSQVSIDLRVARISLTAENGKDYLELGLEFVEITDFQREVIGQYLIQFSDAESLRAIREEGFFPTSLTKGVDYQYIKTAAEFEEVLELRLLANKAIAKIPAESTPADMADIYDTRSRIIVGRYKGKVIGTMRMTFNELGEQLEHERYVELPSDFPRGEQILEVGRAATHPDFRGSDLWNTLMQHVTIAAVQANRPWVVISAASDLMKMYSRLGLNDTGLRYVHDLYPDTEHAILYANLRELVVAKGVGPIYWNVVWKVVGRHLAQADKGIATQMTSARVRFYTLLSPFAQLLVYFSANPRRRKKKSSNPT